MASVKTTTYTMSAGETRSIPVSIPLSLYSTGSIILFGIKLQLDADLTDAAAFAKKTLTDANITSTTATTVNYLLQFLNTDTDTVPPNTYFAGFRFVNPAAQINPSDPAGVVLNYPDNKTNFFKLEIVSPTNNRL